MSKKFLYLFTEGHDAFGGDQTTMKNTLGGNCLLYTSERRELPDGRKPLGRDLGQHLIACKREIRIRLAGAASHAPADLVQLAQSHAGRIFKDQRVAVAHIDACLDQRRADKNIDLIVQ